jgi:2-methylaconitate cis-trans-isomerase PrpF
VDVRIFNTNTSRLIVDTIEVDENGDFQEDGDYTIPGVKGTASEIKVAFVDPAGSMTGKLFPTGRRSETIEVKEHNGSSFSVKATLIDAANPFVVVDAATLPPSLQNGTKDDPEYLDSMELIRSYEHRSRCQSPRNTKASRRIAEPAIRHLRLSLQHAEAASEPATHRRRLPGLSGRH